MNDIIILISAMASFTMLSSFLKSLMDLSSEGDFKFSLGLINHKNDTWDNKYRIDRIGNVTANTNNNYYHWYYLGLYEPKYVERFPFSSTILVSMTDDGHMFQFFMYRAIDLALTAPLFYLWGWWSLIALAAIPSIRGLVFEANYNVIKKRNRKKRIKRKRKNALPKYMNIPPPPIN